MKLREITRVYCAYSKRNPDSTLVHLLLGIEGGRGTTAFCGAHVVAVASESRFEDVCPRCVSTAKHVGCRA